MAARERTCSKDEGLEQGLSPSSGGGCAGPTGTRSHCIFLPLRWKLKVSEPVRRDGPKVLAGQHCWAHPLLPFAPTSRALLLQEQRTALSCALPRRAPVAQREARRGVKCLEAFACLPQGSL